MREKVSQSSHLINHSHYSHWRERPYIVRNVDGQGFITSSHFTQDFRIHTGEKPFLHKDCGKGFAQSIVILLSILLSKLEKHPLYA